MPEAATAGPPVVTEPPPAPLPLGLAEPALEELEREQIQEEVQELMSQASSYDADVLIIGSGPGGYVAAIRAAQLGARVVCVERNPREWGGVCLNWGCIPTKAIIASVERLHQVKTASRLGVETAGEVGFDFGKIMARKEKIVSTLRGGVVSLLKSNHVQQVNGTARLLGPNSVEVTAEDGAKQTITARAIVIATGSAPAVPPVPGLEGEGVWTSNEALAATEVPASVLVVGAGAVGMEFAYIYNGLGSKVTVVEMMDEVLPLVDSEVAAELRKSLTRQGMAIHVGTRLNGVERTATGFKASLAGPKGEMTAEAQVVLVAVGRRPVTQDLGLEAVGVEVTRGGITVNERMETTVPGIYAIGDVTGKYLLAHVASHQGIVAVENAMGHDAKMDYRAIPGPIFTEPEVATVGLTEKEARDKGYDVVVGRFAFRPLGKSMAMDMQEGMVKVIGERKYGEILGVHIVGPHASDMIHEAVTAIRLESTIDELVNTVHAHPTLPEAMLEAAMDVRGEAIHKPKA